MRRLATRTVSILLTPALCAGVLAGCANFQIPRIDPSGERILIVDGDISDPNAANSRFRDYPASKTSEYTSAVVLCPQATVAPVGSEVVMLAAVRGEDNYLRTNERVEWMLSPNGVGQFVEVHKGSWTDPLVCDFTRARKIDNSFAVNSTSRRLLRLTRGTPQINDDVHVLRGQAWLTVTSPIEGTSNVTAYAPNVHGWERRKDSARIHWVDAQWTFPSPVIAPAGSTRVLTTTVARHTDQSPRSGWIVQYEILDGPAAGFSPSTTQVAEVPTDNSGAASVEILQKQPSAGTNRIAIRVICPAGLCVSELREPLTLGNGCTLVTWSSADVSLTITGPASANIGSQLKYRIQVSNPGDLPAHDLLVTAAIPAEISYLSSNPPAQKTGSEIRWSLSQLAGGQTRNFDIVCRAQSMARVELCAEASAKGGFSARQCAATNIQSPKIEVQIRGPNRAIVGEQVTYELVVTNRAKVAATDLVIRDSFDQGLEHAEVHDNRIEREFGTLQAGESRSIAVAFRVARAGRLCHQVQVRGPGGLIASDQACLEATPAALPDRSPQPQPLTNPKPEPKPPPPPTNDTQTADPQPVPGPVRAADSNAMSVRIEAPSSSLVGQQPTFQVMVTNNGDQELTEVNLSCLVDPELYVLQATTGHKRRESDGAILFELPPIPPGEIGLLSEVLCRCVSEAERACFVVEATCRQGIRKNSQACLAIRAATPNTQSGLTMTVDALRNPIALGRELTCQIQVTNNSPVPDRNVVVEMIVPNQMIIDRLRTRGPVPFSIDQQTIRFEPVDSLPSNETLQYRIRLGTRTAGDAVLRAAVTSYNLPTPLVQEEKTTINDTE